MPDPTHLTDPDRFWREVDRRAADECWHWTGRVNRYGYGEFRFNSDGKRRYHRAHRVAYWYAVGAIPPGLVLDHVCRARTCCNPAHLEPVTNAENLRRAAEHRAMTGERTAAHNAESCRNGHAYESGSFRLRDGRWRVCLICEADRKARWRERRAS